MVKDTTPFPCIGLNESDAKLYIFEGKNHRHLKNILIYTTRQFMLATFFQERSTFFRRRCKQCASRFYEHIKFI